MELENLSDKAAIQFLEDLVNEVFGFEAGDAPDIYKKDYDDLIAFEAECRLAIESLRSSRLDRPA